jgi:signal peptidase I
MNLDDVNTNQSPESEDDDFSRLRTDDSKDDYMPVHARTGGGRSWTQLGGEWLGILIGALVLAVVIKTFVAQTFYIPSPSMERTLLVNDRVLVNKLAYRVGTVHRGDIVVFKRPPKEVDTSITDLIKRVVGLPGETIESRNGVVYINGKALSEPYLQPGMPTNDLPPTVVPADHYFVMGDNRTNSFDSRRFDAIDESYLVGRAELRIWPVDRIAGL